MVKEKIINLCTCVFQKSFDNAGERKVEGTMSRFVFLGITFFGGLCSCLFAANRDDVREDVRREERRREYRQEDWERQERLRDYQKEDREKSASQRRSHNEE